MKSYQVRLLIILGSGIVVWLLFIAFVLYLIFKPAELLVPPFKELLI